MHNNFKAISISHLNAPVAVREQMALNTDETVAVLEYIRELYAIRDVLVLSTCNRTEIYYASDQDLRSELIKALTLNRTLNDAIVWEDYFESITDHDTAVKRLFQVAIGLRSQIVGDMQITNQVKNAYQLAADADLAGPFLHRLLHTTFYVNKKVVQETEFRDGAASVSYATVELVDQLAVTSETPTILVLGVGTVGSDICKNLSSHKRFQDYRIILANRTFSSCEELARECGFMAIKWHEIGDYLQEADVVISAVNSPQPVIKEPQIEALNILKYKYYIDLGLPRSIEHEIEKVNGVVLYNIDDIHSRTDRALKKRMAAIPQVEAIIEDAVHGFKDWSKEMSVNPTINKLKNALEQIRREEIARHLKNSSSQEAQMVDKVTKSMMQKVMKLPVLQLKAACKRGEAETLIDLLNDLFDLEKAPSPNNNE